MITLQLTVPDMACSACSDTITQAIQAIDATATVQADTQTKLVTIETQVAEPEIKQVITKAGYTVT
jgi:copper chaperone